MLVEIEFKPIFKYFCEKFFEMFATFEFQKQAKLCHRVAFFESIDDNYMKSKDDNDFKTEKL